MGAMEFAAKPEVRAYATRIYFAPVPPWAFLHGEPGREVYTLEVSATPGVVRGIYRAGGAPGVLFALRSYADDLSEQFAFDVWRQLAGHVIPYAVYSSARGGMLMKLSSDDELSVPCRDIRVGSWRI